jgi:4-amino-4-deoxy-L-arabinose transferase-like glycosyltransferase
VSRARFLPILGALTGAGLVFRLVNLQAAPRENVNADGLGYFMTAVNFSTSHQIVNPLNNVATAKHPPLWPMLLSIMPKVGQGSIYASQVFACCVGVTVVFAIGLAGRRIAGERAGLVAAAIAAFYPWLWMYERALLSETIFFPLVAITLLLVYRFRGRPGYGAAAWLGLVIGLMLLVRSEQVLLYPLVVAPLMLARPNATWLRRIGWLAVAGAVTGIVLVPWAAYNHTRFTKNVIFTDNTGNTMLAGACDKVFSGPNIGSYDQSCVYAVLLRKDVTGDESEVDGRLQQAAIDYTRAHLGELPAVSLARQGRAWSFYQPFAQTELDTKYTGFELWAARVGLYMYWVLVPLAVYGLVKLRRRSVPIYPLLGFAVIVVLITAITFGETRYRSSTEVPLVIAAAAGIDALLTRWRGDRAAADADVIPDDPDDQGTAEGATGRPAEVAT